MTPPATAPDLALGGVSLARAHAGLRVLEPGAQAFWIYDLDLVATRLARFRAAFAPLAPRIAYALKANALPEILDVVRDGGAGADAGSLGELELARAARFEPGARILNGNGRTVAEAQWAALHGVHSINADHVDELDLLDRAAAEQGTRLRVALRVNPGIDPPTHRYVSTGSELAKFGIAPAEALEAWSGRARWPNLALDGLHVHVGSQIQETAAIERTVDLALELARESASRGAVLGLVNLGGGFGVDYTGGGAEFPIERYTEWLRARTAGLTLDWVLEPGRWLVAAAGVLVAEVLWVKRRQGRRFIVLGAGMNDLIRPALYAALHRIVPVRPRPGPAEPATVVGPVCESSDVFAADLALPPLERGDLVALLDAGAYGSTMSSNYNGRGRLAELVVRGAKAARVRPGETVEDLVRRRSSDPLDA